MIIERFLYNELSYTINTGKAPVVVNSEKVHNKVSVPFVNWEINFGVIDTEFKNFLEESLFLDSKIELVTNICPAYRVIKEAGSLYYIYKHELDFYGPEKLDLNRTLDASFLNVENFLDVPNKLLKNNLAYKHITLFLQDSFTVTHKASGLLECKCSLKEYFKPTSFIYTTEGASYASDITNC